MARPPPRPDTAAASSPSPGCRNVCSSAAVVVPSATAAFLCPERAFSDRFRSISCSEGTPRKANLEEGQETGAAARQSEGTPGRRGNRRRRRAAAQGRPRRHHRAVRRVAGNRPRHRQAARKRRSHHPVRRRRHDRLRRAGGRGMRTAARHHSAGHGQRSRPHARHSRWI